MLRDRLLLAALLVLVALTYLPALEGGFVWLDHLEIVEGKLIATRFDELPGLLVEDRNYAGYHRPVYNLVHSFDRAVWGLDPFGFHLSSLLLHLGNVALVVALARAAGFRFGAAWVTGALFGLHPIHTASVGLIHAKADLVSCLTLALCLVLMIRALRSPPPHTGMCVASIALFVVALLTKELAFVLPLGLALSFALGVRPPRASAWAFWVLVATMAAIAFAAFLQRLGDLEAYHSPVPWSERLLTFTTVYVDALRRLIVPTHLFVGDTVTRFGALDTPAQVRALVTFALLVAAQGVALWRWPKSRPWILVLNLAFAPVAQIVPILHFRADRFLYLPSIGLIGLAVAGVETLADRAPKAIGVGVARVRFVAGLAALVVLALFARRTADRLRDFVDDETLFRTELARVPDYVEGQTALARALDRAGRHAEATPLWLRSLERNDDRISYQNLDVIVVNLGNNLIALERHREAYELLTELGGLVHAEDARAEADYNLAIAAYRTERYAEAVPLFTVYAKEHPDDAPTLLMLGACAIGVDDASLARSSLTRFLELAAEADPNRAVAERWLAEL